MRKVLAILNFIEKICVICSSISVLAIMLLTTFDALARKFFDYSIPSLYELTADYLMVALVYLSLSAVYSKGGHIRVTLFLRLVPKVIKPVLDKLLDLIALVLFGFITIVGWNKAVLALQFNEVSSSLLAYPLAPALFLVPIGVGLLAIRLIQSLLFPQSIKEHQESASDAHMSA